MAFADWKKKSRIFRMFADRADSYGIGLTECCQAAYKAGERQGRKDAEAIAQQAIYLRDIQKGSRHDNQ